MADMAIVIDRYSAGVHIDLSRGKRQELFFFLGEGIVEIDGHV